MKTANPFGTPIAVSAAIAAPARARFANDTAGIGVPTGAPGPVRAAAPGDRFAAEITGPGSIGTALA